MSVLDEEGYPMTLAEIGQAVGVSEATVCREVQDAIRQLWRSQVHVERTPMFGLVVRVRRPVPRPSALDGALLVELDPERSIAMPAQQAFRW